MTIQRYGLGREYAGNTGSPAITEQADGAYVRYEDFQRMDAGHNARHDLLALRTKKAEGAQTSDIEALGEQCNRLQDALAFYMPDAPEAGHPLHDRIAQDAYLLFGYDGNSGVEPSAHALGLISLSRQPAEPVIKESLTVAEPVKLPSDEETRRLWQEVIYQAAISNEDHRMAFARALLARYGAAQPPTSAKPAASAAPDCSNCGGFGSVTGDHPDIECSVCNGTGKSVPVAAQPDHSEDARHMVEPSEIEPLKIIRYYADMRVMASHERAIKEQVSDAWINVIDLLARYDPAMAGDAALLDMLETLCNGLEWSIENHPEVMNESDAEALARARALLKRVHPASGEDA